MNNPTTTTTTTAVGIPNENRNKDLKRIYSNPKVIKLLKTLFENENYSFCSFSSRKHGELVNNAIKKSDERINVNSIQLTSDSNLNEFVNHFYSTFSNYLYTNNLNETTTDGMIEYKIYSIQTLNSISNENKVKSIWLSKSITISEAHRIFSTVLYSSNMNKIPVDLADYVIVYENIMIPFENQNKELYEELLKISFRLNRVALSSFRLLIIHKSQLLLLERKESEPLLKDNESIAILQLIMYHLIRNNSAQLKMKIPTILELLILL